MELSDVYNKIDLSKSYSPYQLRTLSSKFQSDISISSRIVDAEVRKLIQSTIICVPVHNEEVFIRYFTESLLNQIDINSKWKIILVLNACTDNTKNELLETLKRLNIKRVDNSPKKFVYKNLNIEIIETDEGGKVLALKKVLNFANAHKYKYFINIDSDFILQKDTLISLILEYKKILQSEEKRNNIITGSTIRVYKDVRMKDERLSKTNELLWSDQKYTSVVGALFLTTSNWLDDNLEEIINEDYFLGLKLRQEDGVIYKSEASRIWGYFPDQQDSISQLARSIRGRIQIIKKFPELKSQIEEDNFFMRPTISRIMYITSRIAQKPQHLRYWIRVFRDINYAYKIAEKEEKAKPNGITWTRLTSTKGL